ncbi:MAG: hypothetical protein IJ169_00275, partial [Paludibacteraceae bacterium]|nr:hypothetical protein [Paludibacteraceae bacterium]
SCRSVVCNFIVWHVKQQNGVSIMHEMAFIKVTDGTQLCRKQPTVSFIFLICMPFCPQKGMVAACTLFGRKGTHFF